MRARNVKPGFFQNEQLAELPFEARLLFVGLWCLADREGRLEDRPRRIKMHVFPADIIDVEPLLTGLVEQGLIVRYESEGVRCIAIPKFREHQRPHVNEAPSVLPTFPVEPKLATKAASASNQGQKHFALNPDSLNPECSLSERGRDPAPTTARGSAETPRAEKRAARIPEDFALTPERRAVAEAEKLPAERTFAKFCNFWRAASGAKARKHDWDATWQNWCMSENDRNGVSRGNSKASHQARLTAYERSERALEDWARERGIDPATI